MTLTGDMPAQKARRYYHAIPVIIGVDVLMNFLFVRTFNADPIKMDFVAAYAILEFIFLAAVIYCLSARNPCLKELKEANARHPLS